MDVGVLTVNDDRYRTRFRRRLDAGVIDQIFKETVEALKDAREQIFDIAESARAEYERLKRAVEELRKEAERSIATVDRLEVESRKAKRYLAQVSQDFSRHSQQEIREAYEAAERIQIELSVARERELSLRRKRDELERSLVNVKKLVEKAERMVTHVTVAMEYLLGGLERIADQWKGIKVRSQIGEWIIRAQEEERRRVAREIHDGPAQTMANLVLRAEICEKLLQVGREEVREELARLKELIKESLRELRRIIFNLRPMALDDLGLVPTLNRYLENLREQEAVPIGLVVKGAEIRLSSSKEVALFRMVQEAVNNARKHARASHIDVTIDFTEARYVHIWVQDDGVGFDIEALQAEWIAREHFGLMSMKERIELLGGDFSVVSAAGKGTRIAARVPIDDGAEADDVSTG